MTRKNLKRIRQALRGAGVRQKAIAKRLGITESTFSRYVHGHIPMTLAVVEALRKELVGATGREWTLDEVAGRSVSAVQREEGAA